MEILKAAVWIVNLISALGVIGLVLMQHGKGADMGAAFGSGSAGSLFGASGSSNFLSRATALCAVVFFSTCLALVFLSSGRSNSLGVMSQSSAQAKTQQGSAVPAKKPSGLVPE